MSLDDVMAESSLTFDQSPLRNNESEADPTVSAGPSWPVAPAVLLLVLLAEILARILEGHLPVSVMSREEKRLSRELIDLRRQAEDLNTPDTFARAAKLQRAAAAKEKELQQLRQRRAPQLWPLIRRIIPLLLRAGLYWCLVGLLWQTPVVILPPNTLAPLGRALAFPNGPTWLGGGAVAIVPWLALCNRVCSYLLAARS